MISAIFKSINSFFRLCLLRGTPSELPYSWELLGFLIIGCWADVFFAPAKENMAGVFVAEIVAMGVAATIIYALLRYKKLLSHFHKTIMAWFGTELIFNIIAKIFFDQDDFIGQTQNPGLLVFSVWYLVVKSYILRKSMEISFAMAFLVLMGILIAMSIPVLFILTPEATAFSS